MKGSKTSDPKSGPRRKRGGGNLLLIVGRYLWMFTIPALTGTVAWYFVAGPLGWWSLDEGTATAAFLIGVPVIACVVSVGLQLVDEWRRRQVPSKSLRSDGKGRRVLVIVLGGILIPLVVSSVVSWARVSGNRSLFTIVLGTMKAREEDTLISAIGNTVISAESYDTKTQGVQTLAALHSSASLDELFRVMELNPSALNNRGFYRSMSQALASYGSSSRDRLTEMLRDREDLDTSASPGPDSGLHEAYFEGPFDDLRRDIERAALDEADRESHLLRVDEVEVQVRAALQGIESDQSLVGRGDPIPDFVLDTFLLMNEIEGYGELYLLCKSIAASPAHLAATRSKAILLLGKLGSEADVTVVVPYLQSEDEAMKAAALRAIRDLHERTRNVGEGSPAAVP